MKQRVISAVAALAVLACALFLFDTIIFNVMISIVCALGVYEFLLAANLTKYKSFVAVCIIFAGIVPFVTFPAVRNLLPIILYIFFITMFCILLKHHNTLRYDQIAFGFFAAMFMSASLATGALMKATHGNVLGLLYVCTALGGAWFSDTGAYFIGVTFGKHKLAPDISPKKTVEGAIGAVVTAEIFLIILSYCFTLYTQSIGITMVVDYTMLILLAPVISILGILGDLCASIIKRQCGVKDFGSIMPGHGGVVDRFDSVLFIMPMMYIISNYMPLYQIVA